MRRAVCETLEARRMLSGLPADNVEDLTAITSVGNVVTTDTGLQGPYQFPFTNGQVKEEVVQPDGKRLVAGYANGNWAIARYDADGALDTTFGGGDGKSVNDLGTASDRALNISLRPDGKIILLGVTAGSGDNWQFSAIRLNSNGALDATFADNGKLLSGLGRAPTYGGVSTVLIDGRIHMTGWDGTTSRGMAFDADGKNGFDRLANFHPPLRTQDLHTVPMLPARGSMEWYGRTMPFSGPVESPTSGPLYPQSNEASVFQGTAYSITIPAGTRRSINWGDGVTSPAPTGIPQSHFYSSTGSKEITVNGYWNPLAAPKNFHADAPTPNADGRGRVVRTVGINLPAGGKIDLDNNDLVVEYPATPANSSPFSSLQSSVFEGYSAELDTSKTGIVSTHSQTIVNGTAILALFDNALAGSADWPPGSGQTVASNAVIGKYTFIGDTNMDGEGTPQDYTAWDANLGTTVDPKISWFYGDTNFDGSIDATDVVAIDSALGLGTGTGANLDLNALGDVPLMERTVAVMPELKLDTVDVERLMEGPSTTDEGSVVRFNATNRSESRSYIWAVTKNGSSYTSGEGASFNFTPGDQGSYQVELVVLGGAEGPRTATQTVTVVNVAPRIKIDGPPRAYAGHFATLIGSASDRAGENDPLTYLWSVTKDNVPFGLPPTARVDLSSFSFKPLDAGVYVASLSVQDGDGGTSNATYSITAAVDPGGADYTKVSTDFSGLDDTINSLAIQPDGKILAGGLANGPQEPDGVDGEVFALMRYNPDLSPDTTFGPNGDGKVMTAFPGVSAANQEWHSIHAVLLQPSDGKIIAVGEAGVGFALARYNTDGSLDDTFGDLQTGSTTFHTGMTVTPGVSIALTAILQPDGKILAGGVGIIGLHTRFALARYNPDGSLDTSFGENGIVLGPIFFTYGFTYSYHVEGVKSLLLLPDGKIMAAGDVFRWTDGDGPPGGYLGLARYNSDGSLDTTFGVGGITTTLIVSDVHVRSLVRQPDGKLIVEGWDSWALAVVRYNEDGTLDTSFGTNGVVSTASAPGWQPYNTGNEGGLVLQADGKLVIASTTANREDFLLARYNSDGTIDTSFGSSGDGTVIIDFDGLYDHTKSIVLDSDSVLVGGYAWDAATYSYNFALVRYRLGGAKAIGLTATAMPADAIELRWVDAGYSEDGFAVERSLNGASGWTVIGTVGSGVTEYSDRAIQPNTTYHYRVYAFDAAGRQGESNVANATTAPINTTYLWQETVVVPIDGSQVQSGITLDLGKQYQIRASGDFALTRDGSLRADAEYGHWDPLPRGNSPWPGNVHYGIAIHDPAPGADPLAVHATLNPGMVKYPYWGAPSTDSDHSYTITVTGKGQPIVLDYHDDYYPDNIADRPSQLMKVEIYRARLGAPSYLTATADRPKKQINLAWTDNSSDEQGFRIERSVDGGAFEILATVAANVTTFADVTAQMNKRHAYRVVTFNSLGASDYSNQSVAVLVNRPPVIAPTAPQFARVGSEFFFAVDATDLEDGADLSYTLEGQPQSMVIDQAGYISGWTPAGGIPSEWYLIHLLAHDKDGGTGERYFAVSVVDPAHAPAFQTAPFATRLNPTQVTLRTLGAPGEGEPNFTYTWSVLAKPAGAVSPTFSSNRTNPAKDTIVTLAKAGTYRFRVTITEPTDYASMSEDFTYIAAQEFTSVRIDPPSFLVSPGSTQSLAATALDQFNNAMASQPAFTWSIDAGGGGGSIAGAGATRADYIAPATSGYDTVRAATGGVSGTAVMIVPGAVNLAPMIDALDVDPLNPTTLQLRARASDDGGEADLIYRWSVVSQPVGTPPVRFSSNGDHAARDAVATCGDGPLTYTFRLTVTDKGGLTGSRDFARADAPVANSVKVTPAVSTIAVGGAAMLTAVVVDKIGRPLPLQPTSWQWEITGITTVNGQRVKTTNTQTTTTGVFAFNDSSEPFAHDIKVTAGGVSGAAIITVADQRPPVMVITAPSDERAPALIDHDTEIKLVVDDPNDDPVTWYLWIRLEGTTTRTLLATGDSEVGSAPSTGASAAILGPQTFPSGNYLLELTRTNYADGSDQISDTRAIYFQWRESLASPANLRAGIASESQINLEWDDSAEPNLRYKVYRGTSLDFTPSLQTLLTPSPISASAFVDTIDSATTGSGPFYYKVVALNDLRQSSIATSGEVNPLNPISAPDAPATVSAVPVTDGSIRIRWIDSSLNEQGFRVERALQGDANWSLVALADANQSTVIDDDPLLEAGSTYIYRVVAFNSEGQLPPTVAAPTTTPTVGSTPWPSHLTGTIEGDQLTLRWFPAATEASYAIEHLRYRINTHDPFWETIGSVPAGTHKFKVGTVGGNVVNSYRITSSGNSSAPARVYWSPDIFNVKKKAFDALILEEAKHYNQPYYTYNMNGFAGLGLRGLFDRLSLALDQVAVIIDDGMGPVGQYRANTDTLALHSVMDEYTVTHELVHAVDDLNSWHINVGGVGTEAQEAFAYAVELMLKSVSDQVFIPPLPPTPNSKLLDKFTKKSFATAASAQTAWNKAWNEINNTIGNTIFYRFLNPFKDDKRPLASADIADVKSKLRFFFSSSALLPVYNQYLVDQGLPAGTLTNAFTFTLDPVFA